MDELKHGWRVYELTLLYVLSHTFLGIIPDEIHTLTSTILVNLAFFVLLVSSLFSLTLTRKFLTSKLIKLSLDPYYSPKKGLN